MMQVVFPACDLPPTKITSKPSVSFLYRVSPKVDSNLGFASQVTTSTAAASLPLNRRKSSQGITSFSSPEKRHSHYDVFNQAKPHRPVVRRWSNSFEHPVLGSMTARGRRPDFRSPSNKTEIFLPSKRVQVEDVVFRSRSANTMPNQRFLDPSEDYCGDDLDNTNLLSLFTSRDVPRSHPSSQQHVYTPPSTGISLQAIKTMPWSTWIKNRTVTATAQVCPDAISNPTNQNIPTISQNPPISSKTEYASFSDTSPRVPVKGILKSCRSTSHSPSLEDGENAGSTNTSKSLSSQGSKKHVQFLETDAIASVPREPYGQTDMESNDMYDIDRGIIDAYNSTNDFTLCQNGDPKNDGDTKLQTMNNEMSFPECNKQIVCANTGSKTPNHKNRFLLFSDRQKRNRTPLGLCRNEGVSLNEAPFGIHDKTTNDLYDLQSNSCAPVSKSRPAGAGAKNDRGSVIKLAHKFASLPRRSKSKHNSNPPQFSVPPFPSEATLSRILMSPNVEVPRKAPRKGSQISQISEKENNNLPESGSWVSLKGPKNKGKGPNFAIRPKLLRQGDNFCSEEKTLRIMEWLDTVSSQRADNFHHVPRPATVSK